MILSKILNKNYWNQNIEENINHISEFIKNKNLLLFHEFNISYFNNKEALYSFSDNFINIPNNFYRLDRNYLQFESIQTHLTDKTLEFIVKHEFGHLNHHQFLSLSHNHSENFEYVTLNSNSNYIKTNTALDNLFDRTFSKPNPIEDFIHMNFMEAYADSYSGVISYLQDKDKSIFAKIFNLRLSQFKELKESDNLTLKQNSDNHSIAEVYLGKLATSRYSNYLTSKYIKENIIEQFSYEKLSNISINDLHNLIQLEVLSSLQETLKKEIKTNPLFSNQFNDYLINKNMSITDYFKEFNNGILEYKEKTYLNIIHGELLTNNKNKLIEFINFHANNNRYQSSGLFSNFINKEQEEDLYKTLKNLNNEGKLEQNKKGLSKYIVSNFMLPQNEYNSLIKDLLIKDKSNDKFTEIISSLDSDTKSYLINSYNSNPKLEPIPALKNYTQQQLIKIFTDSLNDKNKKEFKKLETQYNLTEISTPYLSSNFNANVLNNDSEASILKSKNECLGNIKNIRNKLTSIHNNTSTIKPTI